MKGKFLASVGVVALSIAAMLAFPSVSMGQTKPPMGGGYTDVIPIPVNDPATKAIAGALFKPAGAGPFPAIIYMSGCGGVDTPPNRAQQKAAVDHLLSKGVATLIVDPFTPRNEPDGVCANLGNLDRERATQYSSRGGNDALAALNVLKAMPDIDTKHIFLQGYSLGATSSLFATDKKNPANHDAKVAGIIRVLSLLLRRRRSIGSCSRHDWRERRLDTSREVSGGHRQDRFQGRCLSRRYSCLHSAR
ncbi:MAG TPA: dienelactone hydrolase family protein [Xanthobacteraceae bacterium]